MLLAQRLETLQNELKHKYPSFKQATISRLAKDMLEVAAIPDDDDDLAYERRCRVEYHRDQILDRANHGKVVFRDQQDSRIEETATRINLDAAKQGIQLRDRNPAVTDPTSVDFRNPSCGGNTKLHMAVWEGDLAAVKKLCMLGANAHTKNSGGVTPYSLAISLEHNEIVAYFEASLTIAAA